MHGSCAEWLKISFLFPFHARISAQKALCFLPFLHSSSKLRPRRVWHKATKIEQKNCESWKEREDPTNTAKTPQDFACHVVKIVKSSEKTAFVIKTNANSKWSERLTLRLLYQAATVHRACRESTRGGGNLSHGSHFVLSAIICKRV